MSEEPAGHTPSPDPVPPIADGDRPVSQAPEGAPDGAPPPRHPPAEERSAPAGDADRQPVNERARALGPGSTENQSRAERPDVAGRAEENLDGTYEDTSTQARQVRDDIPEGAAGAAFSFHAQTTVGSIAGRDMYHYYHFYNFTAGGQEQARGPVSVSTLIHVARVHVPTDSDATLRARCAADRVVILRGRLESGRRSSAVAVLDSLTGTVRTQSLVSVVDAAAGLGGLAGRLAKGHGHLLDASGGDWLEEISEAQLGGIRDALEEKQGYLIVLSSAAASPPPHVTLVDHEPPEPARVIRSHLAAHLAGAAEVTPADFTAAEALLRDALDASAEARQWEQELTGQSAQGTMAAPAEAAHLVLAIAEWAARRDTGEPSAPRVRHYRNMRLQGQARVLLGRGDRSDAPLRQAYVIATAALDGMAVSEVADQARQLAALLDKAEGGARKRRVFAETLTHWLGHADMAASVTEGDRSGTDVAVVRLPSRKLARTIVEVAWLDYDAAREPMRNWLVRTCGEHRDERVRIRAAQALAFIAAHDYSYIKSNVLDPWSESDRAIEHQAAAWLLEAAAAGDVAGGQMKTRVEDLLRRWSRSEQWQKRAIAVRAYGTKIGTGAPEAARSGIRISAADPYFGTLPELALGELYADGLRRMVMQELDFWTHAFPVMRERVGRALVRVSWVRHANQPGTYDLLWRMAHQPESAGIELDTLGRLWQIACEQRISSGAAWKALGLWAKSSRRDSAQRDTFVRLTDIFEQAVDHPGLRERFSVHRRQWNEYLDKEFTR
jgi:hypothetical protein